MGGKNHQPCKHFLANSTRMSLASSLAVVGLEQGNAALELHLLAELDGTGVSHAAEIDFRLGDSLAQIEHFRLAVDALRQQMQAEGYQELPSVRQMNLVALGTKFREAGILTRGPAWEDVSVMMKGPDGFYAILDTFVMEIGEIEKKTIALREKIAAAIGSTTSLVDLLEQNREGNFKVEFAQLYSAWIRFQQFFLASSMLSTEAWYRFTEAGSLVDKAAAVRAAA